MNQRAKNRQQQRHCGVTTAQLHVHTEIGSVDQTSGTFILILILLIRPAVQPSIINLPRANVLGTYMLMFAAAVAHTRVRFASNPTFRFRCLWSLWCLGAFCDPAILTLVALVTVGAFLVQFSAILTFCTFGAFFT